MEDNDILKSIVDSLIKERESERRYRFVRRIIIFSVFGILAIKSTFLYINVTL